jgi:hypothetical protein
MKNLSVLLAVLIFSLMCYTGCSDKGSLEKIGQNIIKERKQGEEKSRNNPSIIDETARENIWLSLIRVVKSMKNV